MRRALALLVLLTSCSTAPTRITASPTPSQLTPERPTTFQTIKVENGPNFIAFARGFAWVTETPIAKLAKIDLSTGKVAAQVAMGTEPGVIVTDGNSLWIGDYSEPVIRRVDPATSKVTASIRLAESAHGLSLGSGALWVGTTRGVVRIDTATNKIVATIATGDASDVVVTPVGVWAGAGTSLTKVDPTTNKIVTKKTVPGGIHSLAFGFGDLWVGGGNVGTNVSRVNATTGDVIATIAADPVGFPDRVAFSKTSVYVGEYKADTVLVIDPGTNRITRKIATDNGPAVVAVNDDTLWISHSNGTTVWRVEI